MPFTASSEQSLLDSLLNANLYAGSIMVQGYWSAAATVTAGEYMVGTLFATTNRKIYVCTTPGTTGATEPVWNQTAGATTADGTAVWTETSILFASGSFTGTEPTDPSYARVPVTNATWTAASGSNPASKSNVSLIAWPISSQKQGNIAAVLISTAVTAGTYKAWGLASDLLDVGSANITPQIAIGGVTVKLT